MGVSRKLFQISRTGNSAKILYFDSSVATTTKVYVHAIQSANEIAADQIEEKLDPMKRVKKREEE